MTDKTIHIINLYENDVRARIEQPEMRREWMDNTSDKYAYRCLPLNIANQHGWAVYPNEDITVVWNGGTYKEDIKIVEGRMATSAFGHGILTFHLPFMVRTSDNYNLYISGAPNHPISGAYALTGVYEADWTPYTFTMNWQLTSIYEEIKFSKNDPICFFFPVERDSLNDFKFTVGNLNDEDPEFINQFKLFCENRQKFLDGEMPGLDWQKNYFQGKMPDGAKCPIHNHRTKVKLDQPIAPMVKR